MHAFVVCHTGIQPQSNLAVLQALQVDDANSLLAAVHMHSVDTCYSILHYYQREVTRLQATAGLLGEAIHEEQPPPGTHQDPHQNSPAFGPKPKRNKHHRHSRPSQRLQASTQGITWPPQPQPAAHLPMIATTALRPDIRLEWHPGQEPDLPSWNPAVFVAFSHLDNTGKD